MHKGGDTCVIRCSYMKPPGHTQSDHKPDTKDWPELAPTRTAITPDQALAQTVVKMQAENAGKLLVVRTKALLGVVVLALISVVQNIFYVVPPLLRGEANVAVVLLACSMLLQLCATAYFLRAKDPQFAAQVLRLMLIINGVVLLMGFAWLGSLPLTIAILVVMLIAQQRMRQLRYGNE